MKQKCIKLILFSFALSGISTTVVTNSTTATLNEPVLLDTVNPSKPSIAYAAAKNEPVWWYTLYNSKVFADFAKPKCAFLSPVLNKTATTLPDATKSTIGYLNLITASNATNQTSINQGLYPMPLSIISSIILNASLSDIDFLFQEWSKNMIESEKTQIYNLLLPSNTINKNGVSISFKYSGKGTAKKIESLEKVFFNGVEATFDNTFTIPKGTLPNILNPYDQLWLSANVDNIFAKSKALGLIENNEWFGNIEGLAILDPLAVNFLRSDAKYKLSLPRTGAANYSSMPLYVPHSMIYSPGQSVIANNLSGLAISDGFWVDLSSYLLGEGTYNIAFPFVGVKIFDSAGVARTPTQLNQLFSLPNGKISLTFCDTQAEMEALKAAGHEICSLYNDAVLIIKNGKRYVHLCGNIYELKANDTLEIFGNLTTSNLIIDYLHKAALRFDNSGLWTTVTTTTPPVVTPPVVTPLPTITIKDCNQNTGVKIRTSAGTVMDVSIEFNDDYSFTRRTQDTLQGSKITLGQDLLIAANLLKIRQNNKEIVLTGNISILSGSILLTK